MKPKLTIKTLKEEASKFAEIESIYDEPSLYGVTDGKAVGTYLEHKFTSYLASTYEYEEGNSASGIDLPVKSASQKVFGLGYHLVVFVYEKTDDEKNKTGRLNMQHTIFVEKERTADFQTTKGLIDILERNGNKDDIVAFIIEKNLPVDEIGAAELADRILKKKLSQGYLTLSNALQWRLQYTRVIQKAGEITGILRVR